MGAARPRLLAAGGVGLCWAGASAWLALALTDHIRDWGVMTDELLYAKLATSVAERHSPLPVVHDTAVAVYNQLYPILVAPLFGSLSAPSAFHAAHLLDAPLMASVVFPAYLLAREVVGRPAALAVAVLSVVTPWMVLSGFLMTEVVAYPAFVWAVFAVVRAVRLGGARADLIALAAIGLAVLARVQFLLLLIVFPLAVVLHERRAAWRRHRLLGVLTALALVAAAIAAGLGSLSRVLGVYAPAATRGSLLPHGVWQAAAAHLDAVAIGCGLLPLLLGAGWMLTTVARPRSPAAHAFATTCLLALVAVVLQAASFDVRFGGREAIRDRYVFYVVPLLLAGTAALFAEGRRPWLAPAALTALFAATVHWLPFPIVHGLWVDAPTRVLNDLLARQAGSLGTADYVATFGVLLGIAAVAGLRLIPARVLAPVVFVLVLAFSAFASQRVIDHTVGSHSVSGRGLTADPRIVLDWVDRVLPGGAKAAIVPYPTAPNIAAAAPLWWDVEFWNRSVEQAFVDADGDFHYTPFPSRRLVPDPRTGEVAGTDGAPPYVIAAQTDSRLALVAQRLGSNFGLDILAVPRPYRVQWLTRGLQPDGWTRPGRPATIRVFAQAASARVVTVSLDLGAPPAAPARYALTGGRQTVRGRLGTSEVRNQMLDVCVPGGSFADVVLASPTSAPVPGLERIFAPPPPRRGGVLVAKVVTLPTGRACTARRRPT